jgi:hypothetical protein
MNDPEKSGKTKDVDPLTLTLYVMRNNRYSPIDKLLYIGYKLLVFSVVLSIIGLILLIPAVSSGGDSLSEEVSQAVAGYCGILLIGLPIVLTYRKIVYARYNVVYIALKRKGKI